MLCDHQLVTNHLIDYIDGNLTPKVRKQVEQAINECPTCQSTYQQAVSMAQTASQWQEQAVPEWHRTEYAVRPRQQASGWLNWTALATSALAILMVVFQVQISANDGGLQIAFGTSNNQIDAIVEERLNEYKKQQALMLDARFVAESDKQTAANKIMMADLLEKTRDERRDDLNFIVTGIQTQRLEDQQKTQKRFSYLAENQIENAQYINQLIQSANLSKGDN